MRLAFVVVVVAGTLVAMPPDAAFACSCAPPPSDQEALDTSDAVFAGVVVAKDDPEGGGAVISSGRPITWTFDVDRVDKGDIGSTQEVVSAAGGASCGFSFREGKRYRVFAYESKGGLHTDICTNTHVLAGGPAPPDDREVPIWWVAGIFVGLAVGGTVVVRRRRRANIAV